VNFSILSLGPHKVSLLESLIKQAESLAIPPEDFDTIAPTTAEDKDLPVERILLDLVLRMCR